MPGLAGRIVAWGPNVPYLAGSALTHIQMHLPHLDLALAAFFAG